MSSVTRACRVCVVRCLTVGGDGQRQPRAWRSCRSIDGCGQDPTRTVRSGRAPDRSKTGDRVLRGRCVGRAPPRPRRAGKRKGRRGKVERTAPAELGPCRCAPGPAPCARVACVGRYGMRYFYVAPGIRPFNDPTRPAPHRSPGARSRRRSRRRKRETEPRRGTSYYDVRAARDGRCGLPSAEARPPARASWRKATREIRSYTYELVTNWAVAYREARTKPFRGTPPATPVASRGVAGAARLAALRRAMAGPTARARANAICATMPSYA